MSEIYIHGMRIERDDAIDKLEQLQGDIEDFGTSGANHVANSVNELRAKSRDFEYAYEAQHAMRNLRDLATKALELLERLAQDVNLDDDEDDDDDEA